MIVDDHIQQRIAVNAGGIFCPHVFIQREPVLLVSTEENGDCIFGVDECHRREGGDDSGGIREKSVLRGTHDSADACRTARIGNETDEVVPTAAYEQDATCK